MLNAVSMNTIDYKSIARADFYVGL